MKTTEIKVRDKSKESEEEKFKFDFEEDIPEQFRITLDPKYKNGCLIEAKYNNYYHEIYRDTLPSVRVLVKHLLDKIEKLEEDKSCALYVDYKKSCQALKDHYKNK
jgi:hypothetical protein